MPAILPLFSGHMVHYVDHGICLGLRKISLWVHLVVPFDCGQHFPHGRLLGQWGYGRTSFFVHPSFGFDPDGNLSHLQRPHNRGAGYSMVQSGLRQIQRGLLEGPSGALAYFENSWDAEEDWLGAMSYAAITKFTGISVKTILQTKMRTS